MIPVTLVKNPIRLSNIKFLFLRLVDNNNQSTGNKWYLKRTLLIFLITNDHDLNRSYIFLCDYNKNEVNIKQEDKNVANETNLKHEIK